MRLRKNTPLAVFVALAIFVILMLSFAFFFIPSKSTPIENATVNEENGDIAFCYFDLSETCALIVCVYSQEGEELFTKSFNVSYVADMLFYGTDLHLLVYENGKDIKYSFDRNGNPVKSNVSEEKLEKQTHFDGWNNSIISGTRTYKLGESVYLYQQERPFRRQTKLTIQHTGTSTDVYNSP